MEEIHIAEAAHRRGVGEGGGEGGKQYFSLVMHGLCGNNALCSASL